MSVQPFTCPRCRTTWQRGDSDEVQGITECAICRKLGDRSLLWFLSEMEGAKTDEVRDELRRRFTEARGRSFV